ncbi:TonB-dependent receptor plug domain-containing protein [Polaribacter sp. Hel1_85]|uniref:TonB-dependent receptor plug domain-containing protein n=1 Tax=Polaribacter sp. Hel1_85 TaxID=1250005 RepID=UPI000A70942A|nr:TonB-dependent receptor plug domain-containing protein [Polaribacter sp. Hel1_85]
MNKKLLVITFSFLVITLKLFSQEMNISGKVSDESGELPGVTVLLKGTNIGTTTDFNGVYSIKANKGDVLVFSYLGYKTKEVLVNSLSLNIVLLEDTDVLDEVVVTSFGIKKKEKSLGYAVQQIKTEDLELKGQTSAISALQGRFAGVQINQSSGASGGGLDILIRGVTSVNPNRNNQPLIIVDGLALNNDTFSGNVLPSAGTNSPSSSEQFSFSNRGSDINPEDIESFSVLKGAAATALYGVRASNGAILITTKKGKQGKAKIGISTSTTFRKITKTPELQTTYREGFSGLPRGVIYSRYRYWFY